jgi:hypothetical protein
LRTPGSSLIPMMARDCEVELIICGYGIPSWQYAQ